jgi:hypothetical protein
MLGQPISARPRETRQRGAEILAADHGAAGRVSNGEQSGPRIGIQSARQRSGTTAIDLGGSSESWGEAVPRLAADRHVIAVDMRGAGRSEKPPGAFALADVADDLNAFLPG